MVVQQKLCWRNGHSLDKVVLYCNVVCLFVWREKLIVVELSNACYYHLRVHTPTYILLWVAWCMGCHGESVHGRFSVTPFQLHIWIAKCAPTWCSSIEMIPCDTTAVALTTEVQPIEVWVGTGVVPPGTLPVHSTVTTGPVIVSVMSGERHAIQVVTCHAVPCYPYCCCPHPPVLVPSNSESVVGTWSAHMKIVITGILAMACIVSKVNSQFTLHSYWCKTANLL